MKVQTPARLHFGLLNPTREPKKKYGGIGLAVKNMGYEIAMERSESLEIDSENQECKIRSLVQKIAEKYGLSMDYRINVESHIPSHVGLGSTTQLILSLGKAMTLLSGKDVDSLQIAEDLSRGKRSSIGSYVFSEGGFLVEGGNRESFPQLISRHDFPENWKILVVIPEIEKGPEEEGEGQLFENLKKDRSISEKICYQLVLEMLPALVNEEIEKFGKSVSKIDELAGKAFSNTQGGIFKDKLLKRIKDKMVGLGVQGVGQSSWGPTLYGIVNSESEAERIRNNLNNFLDKESIPGKICITSADNKGAIVEKIK